MSQDFNDLTNGSNGLNPAKKATGSVFPERAYDSATGITRIEPLLTAELFKTRFFFGIPLASPLTKEQITPDMMKDFIQRAAAQFEVDAKVFVSPVIQRHRLPFDPNLYHQHIWCEIPNKPIQKVLRLAICSASYDQTPGATDQYPSGAEIFQIPTQWIDMSYAQRGNIFVNPINPAFSAIGTTTAVAASGATILQFIGQSGWVPAYWTAECVMGFCSESGDVPVFVNEAIGTKAAMLLILNLLPLYRIVSHSMGADGLSQSVSNQLWNILQIKYNLLEEAYKHQVKAVKVLTANTLFSSNV